MAVLRRGLVAAALATALAAAPPAFGDASHEGSGAHDMSAEDHAKMKSGDDHGAAHGSETQSGDDHAAGGRSQTQPGDGHDDHGSAAPVPEKQAADAHTDHGAPAEEPPERPVGLVLGGFGAVNGAVLVAAAVLRRRPDAVKRRAVRAKIRAGAKEAS